MWPLQGFQGTNKTAKGRVLQPWEKFEFSPNPWAGLVNPTDMQHKAASTNTSVPNGAATTVGAPSMSHSPQPQFAEEKGVATTNGAPSTSPAHQQQSAEDLGIIIAAMAKMQQDIADMKTSLTAMHEDVADMQWYLADLKKSLV